MLIVTISSVKPKLILIKIPLLLIKIPTYVSSHIRQRRWVHKGYFSHIVYAIKKSFGFRKLVSVFVQLKIDIFVLHKILVMNIIISYRNYCSKIEFLDFPTFLPFYASLNYFFIRSAAWTKLILTFNDTTLYKFLCQHYFIWVQWVLLPIREKKCFMG